MAEGIQAIDPSRFAQGAKMSFIGIKLLFTRVALLVLSGGAVGGAPRPPRNLGVRLALDQPTPFWAASYLSPMHIEYDAQDPPAA